MESVKRLRIIVDCVTWKSVAKILYSWHHIRKNKRKPVSLIASAFMHAVDIFDIVIVANEFGHSGLGNPPIIDARADPNKDRTIDIFDIVIVAAEFGRPIDPPLPISNLNADITNDGIVDIFDLVIVAAHFGEANP